MIDSFYKKELASHISKARGESINLQGNLQSERAKLDVDLDNQLKRMMADKDGDLKVMRRSNARSSDDPFSIHFAAISGELTRLEVMLAR